MTPIRATSSYTIYSFIFLIAVSLLFLLPNFFQDAPIVEAYAQLTEKELEPVLSQFPHTSVEYHENKVVLLPSTVSEQLEVYQEMRKAFPDSQMNLNLRSQVPRFFQFFSLKPMKLGLDLRGGVHFLLSVDTDSVMDKKFDATLRQLTQWLKETYPAATLVQQDGGNLLITWPNEQAFQKGVAELARLYPEYQQLPLNPLLQLELEPSIFYRQDQHTMLMQTTLTSLRQRINELGVAEASLYTQGQNYIVVDLPGIQDVHQAKELLGKTATVEFYLVSTRKLGPNDPIPPGVYRKKDHHGGYVDLVGRPLLAGQDIIMARADTTPEGRPCVDLRISAAKARDFRLVTGENVGRFMAVLYLEFSNTQRWDQNRQEFVTLPRTTERVLSVARIESPLGDRFQITGLTTEAALNIALMLRAGSLPAPVHIAEEKILGPSMGVENIRMGLSSLVLGLSLIASFMAWYYRSLGLVTNIVLLCNLMLIIMALSLIQATLTLTGIAGIVLTLGMAVDANVIIFERVRDEMRRGIVPWEALDIGLEKATETILDSNITTMIIGVVLFFLGSGSVKGFAITLIIGLLTSVFTALVGTRVLLALFYKGQSQPNLDFLLTHQHKEQPL